MALSKIRDEIEAYIIKYPEVVKIPKSAADDLACLFEQWAYEFLGEYETPESYEPKSLKLSEFTLAHQAVQFHARNDFRRELRKRIERSIR